MAVGNAVAAQWQQSRSGDDFDVVLQVRAVVRLAGAELSMLGGQICGQRDKVGEVTR